MVKILPANAGDMGSIPAPGRSHIAVEQLSPFAKTTELQPRAHDLQQEKPLQWEACALHLESSPQSPQLEKSLCSNEDPAQPKININK